MTRHHGTAGVIAIVLIGLVGASLVAMTAHFGYDARRTSQQATQAQLRQLLIAGAQLIPENPQPNQDLATPVGKLSIVSVTSNEIEMRASLDHHSLTQVLRFEIRDGKRVFSSAESAP